jgi:hypothetical protein
MRIVVVLAVLFFQTVVFADQPAPILPDPNLTPGSTFDVSAQDICIPGYTKKVRNVPAEMKREVYEEYGITSHGPGDYEVDHLIPLELGGSNSIKNLWPESHRTTPWNAQVKDRLEAKLHKLVCSAKRHNRRSLRIGLKHTKNTSAPPLIPATIVLVMPDRRCPIRAARPRRQLNPLQLRFG